MTIRVLALLLFALPSLAAVPQTDARAFLVPVAGNVVGGGGVRFYTDLTITNFSNEDQLVRLDWLPFQGGAAASTTVTVPYLSYLTFPDVVGAKLGLEGIGSILVTAVGEGGSPDPDGKIEGFARIWNGLSCEGVPGTVSQSLPAVSLEGWRDESPAYVHGVRQTSQYRTNVGVVNLDTEDRQRFRVIVNSGLGKLEWTIELEPMTMVQQPVPAGPYGDLSVYVEPVAAEGEGSGPWRAWASSVDNASGSGWTVAAVQPRTDVVYPAGTLDPAER